MKESNTLFFTIDTIADTLTFNLPIMPDFLTSDEIHHEYLYSIYLEAMKCVACGMYSAGIILFGQLYEALLREIIKVKTNNRYPEASFGQLIQIASDKKILEYGDIYFLKRINKGLRTAYVHQKFELIFRNTIHPVFPINISDDDMIGSLQQGIMDVRRGKIQPIFIDLTKDTVLAGVTKKPIDHFNGVLLAWITNTMFDQIFNIYLNQRAYETYITKFGSPYTP